MAGAVPRRNKWGRERESGRQPPPQLVVQTLVREDDPASLEAEQKASRGG